VGYGISPQSYNDLDKKDDGIYGDIATKGHMDKDKERKPLSKREL
jgi:hypothetical protein